MELPADLRRAAHVAGNGELLWPRAAALEVARRLAADGLAIWGGEVYAPKGPFTAVMVDEWRTEPGRGPEEDWASYVERGLQQALAAISEYPESEPAGGAGEGGRSLYFLAHHSPGEAF
jgi:hypothetical protein